MNPPVDARVQSGQTGDIQTETLQRREQLVPAARDEAFTLPDLQLRCARHLLPRLGHRRSAAVSRQKHLPGHDQPFGFFPALGQSLFGHDHIGAVQVSGHALPLHGFIGPEDESQTVRIA